MRRWIHTRVYTLPLAASIGMLMFGCGSNPKPEPLSSAAASNPALVTPLQQDAAQTSRGMPKAKPGAALTMEYDLAVKPQVGVPMPVRVTFVPSAAADTLAVTFSGMDGITLSGKLTATFDAVRSGELHTHEFTVLAERTGVFYVTVNTSMRSGAANMARTFAIPIMVGTQVRSKPAPEKDASGQPIQPMKAKEPT